MMMQASRRARALAGAFLLCALASAARGEKLRVAAERPDVLVYQTEPLDNDLTIAGPLTASLHVSTTGTDADWIVKLIDVYPDGRAYNLDETIQRLRYRNGYDRPVVWLEAGKVYKVTLQPMNTSNYFEAGHRIRLEVSSSNFPRFDRNLNTGGKNYDETKGVVAHNAVHHSKQYPSEIKITVVRNSQSSSR
jgi:putative CocE/NonD family hydrolase